MASLETDIAMTEVYGNDELLGNQTRESKRQTGLDMKFDIPDRLPAYSLDRCLSVSSRKSPQGNTSILISS